MKTATISDKGQLTLPSDIRRQARLQPGMRVSVEWRDGEIVLHPIKSLCELGGVFADRVHKTSESYEEIRARTEAAIAREVANEDRA